MNCFALIVASCIACARAATYCEKTSTPLEVGSWRHHYKNLDSAVVESNPVSLPEGQLYVYDNYFPGYTIKYIHVDNVAMKTCGATATIKTGGVGTSSVFIMMHAGTNQEIRSVVDIWGVKAPGDSGPLHKRKSNMKSLYLAKGQKFLKF